jgi:hypothetical protein
MTVGIIDCGPLRLACFLKLLEPMEIALFQQDFVVAALSIEKIVVLKLSTYFLKLLKTIKTTLFQQEFVIPAYFMHGNYSKPILTLS